MSTVKEIVLVFLCSYLLLNTVLAATTVGEAFDRDFDFKKDRCESSRTPFRRFEVFIVGPRVGCWLLNPMFEESTP